MTKGSLKKSQDHFHISSTFSYLIKEKNQKSQNFQFISQVHA